MTIIISAIVLIAVFMFVNYGWTTIVSLFNRQEQRYERVLVNELLIDINPRTAAGLAIACIIISALLGFFIADGLGWAVVGGVIGVFVPNLIIRHLEQKRRQRLDLQLVDGIVTLASGVRAGLTLIQSIELVANNATGPIKQEFAQLLREYQMGLDLNQAMRNAAARIASPHYRLLFTAIQMHRQRGGDAGESLDRIAAAVRELQRLEGKLDALTSHGRYQAWLMATMPVSFLLLYYIIEPESVTRVFVEPLGRILMLAAAALIVTAFFWIRRIMCVDL